jgi:hypothetical protein
VKNTLSDIYPNCFNVRIKGDGGRKEGRKKMYDDKADKLKGCGRKEGVKCMKDTKEKQKVGEG